MNVVLVNLGMVAVPVYSTQDKGFSRLVEPGVVTPLNLEPISVLNVGENPTWGEELAEGLKDFAEKLAKLITSWKAKDALSGSDSVTVKVSIENQGSNSLRVLLGINTNEVQVDPGEVFEAEAAEYIEIRELGV